MTREEIQQNFNDWVNEIDALDPEYPSAAYDELERIKDEIAFTMEHLEERF